MTTETTLSRPAISFAVPSSRWDDIGSMKLDGFATLYQDKLLGLEKHYGGPEDDDKMVGFLPHCTFNLNSGTAKSTENMINVDAGNAQAFTR